MYISQTKNPEDGFDFSNATAFEVFEDETLTSTTNQPPNWVTKLSGTTTNIGQGKYVICWYAELTNSGNNNVNWFRVQYKKSTDVSYINVCELDLLVTRNEKYEIMSGFKVFEVTGEDTIDFRLQFAREDATARIRNTNLYIFRISLGD